MPHWFSTARRKLPQAATSLPPVPFERNCRCGNRLEGERDHTPQSIRCDTCGETWFVLPRDPYPTRKTKSGKSGKAASPWTRITEWTGAQLQQRTAPEPKPPTKAPTQTTKSPQTPTPPAPPTTERLTARLQSVGTTAIDQTKQAVRRHVRPARLLAAMVVILIMGTGFWLWHQARLDAARETLVTALPAAEEAISDHDPALAAEHFARATAALNLLGATDATAQRIRQRHKEVVAINGLASLTPWELAAEARQVAQNPTEWNQRFQALYAGQWVILDVPLGPLRPPTEPVREDDDESTENATPPTPPRIIPLELPLAAGSIPVHFEWETPQHADMAGLERAIVALQYDSWKLVNSSSGPVWVVRFRPQTGLVWASPDLFREAGFEVNDPNSPTAELLRDQAARRGLDMSRSNLPPVAGPGAKP